MKRALLILGALALVACRSEIQPIVRGVAAKKVKAKGAFLQGTTQLPTAKPESDCPRAIALHPVLFQKSRAYNLLPAKFSVFLSILFAV